MATGGRVGETTARRLILHVFSESTTPDPAAERVAVGMATGGRVGETTARRLILHVFSESTTPDPAAERVAVGTAVSSDAPEHANIAALAFISSPGALRHVNERRRRRMEGGVSSFGPRDAAISGAITPPSILRRRRSFTWRSAPGELKNARAALSALLQSRRWIYRHPDGNASPHDPDPRPRLTKNMQHAKSSPSPSRPPVRQSPCAAAN
jgi:hypothetical protein